MNIFYVTKESFPFGEACTNRVLTYAIEMARKGHNLTIICLMLLSEKNLDMLDINGYCKYKNINIVYAAGPRIWPSRGTKKLYKLWLLFLAYIKSIVILCNNRKKIDLLQMVSAEIFMYNLYGKVCRIFHIPYAVERNELPDFKKNPNRFTSKKGQKYIKKSKESFAQFDGWLLETQTLEDFYSQYYRKNAVLCITPMSVELSRFNLGKHDSEYGRYIAYCGNMREVDGISILIKAYALISSKYPDVKLLLAGYSDDVPLYKVLTQKLKIESKVVFLGKISREEVPTLLCNAEILALASPTSVRSCATMPCKVGEYLATGNPVVVTGLGEINKYLKDNESAYLSAPDSETAFASKLDEALSNKERACMIGINGREVAYQNFSSDYLADQIVQFYNDTIQYYRGNSK